MAFCIPIDRLMEAGFVYGRHKTSVENKEKALDEHKNAWEAKEKFDKEFIGKPCTHEPKCYWVKDA